MNYNNSIFDKKGNLFIRNADEKSVLYVDRILNKTYTINENGFINVFEFKLRYELH